MITETCDACGVALTPERAQWWDFCPPCVDEAENAPEPEPTPVCYCGAALVEQVFMETAKCANGHYGRFR